MRSRFRSESGPNAPREGRPLELVRVRGTQRDTGRTRRDVGGRGRRRSGRGPRPPVEPTPRPKFSFWNWLRSLAAGGTPVAKSSAEDHESRVIADFCRHYELTFRDPSL